MAEVAHPGDRVFVAFLVNTGFFLGGKGDWWFTASAYTIVQRSGTNIYPLPSPLPMVTSISSWEWNQSVLFTNLNSFKDQLVAYFLQTVRDV